MKFVIVIVVIVALEIVPVQSLHAQFFGSVEDAEEEDADGRDEKSPFYALSSASPESQEDNDLSGNDLQNMDLNPGSRLTKSTQVGARREVRAHKYHGNGIKNHLFKLGPPLRPVADTMDYEPTTRRQLISSPINIPHDIRQRFFPSFPIPLPQSQHKTTKLPAANSLPVPVAFNFNRNRKHINPPPAPQPQPPKSKRRNSSPRKCEQGQKETKRNEHKRDVQRNFKKLVRDVMRQTCGQYINLRRLHRLQKNRSDVDESGRMRMLKNCLHLFNIK